jgi:hypothetical protein
VTLRRRKQLSRTLRVTSIFLSALPSFHPLVAEQTVNGKYMPEINFSFSPFFYFTVLKLDDFPIAQGKLEKLGGGKLK